MPKFNLRIIDEDNEPVKGDIFCLSEVEDCDLFYSNEFKANKISYFKIMKATEIDLATANVN